MKKLSEINESGEYLDAEYKCELIEKLQNAFAEEINAWYGYIITAPFLVGQQRHEIAEFYEKTAKDECEDHAQWILERINQLGGTPMKVLTPSSTTIAKHKYITPAFQCNCGDGECCDCCQKSQLMVAQSISQNIQNELGAIETYKALEQFTRDVDPATNRKIKEILADEEEHLAELQDYQADIQATQCSCAAPATAPAAPSIEEPTVTADTDDIFSLTI